MNITIRHLQGEGMLDALYTLNSYSLHPSPPLQNKEDWLSIVRERQGITCHAVFEDETPVSIAVSTSMTQDIPLRSWGDPDLALQSVQRDMFPKMSPYIHENF
jgi:hypothetical protein